MNIQPPILIINEHTEKAIKAAGLKVNYLLAKKMIYAN